MPGPTIDSDSFSDRVKSWFLGPKAENADFVESLIVQAFRDYVFWRRNYCPRDKILITEVDKKQSVHDEWVVNFKEHHQQLLAQLKDHFPFYSPRYIGHMLSDQIIPSMIGYFSAMLYNPNNVTDEAAPVTVELEVQVGRDICRLLGYNERASWSHITSGGTVANFEAFWAARNTKFFPLVAKQVAKEMELKVDVTLPNLEKKPLNDVSNEDLLNIAPVEALNLRKKIILAHYEESRKSRYLQEAVESLKKAATEVGLPDNFTGDIQHLYSLAKELQIDFLLKTGERFSELTEPRKRADRSKRDPSFIKEVYDSIVDHYIRLRLKHKGEWQNIEKEVDDNVNACSLNISTKGLFILKDVIEEFKQPKVLVSRTVHYSVIKVIEALGLGKDAIELVAIDKNFRLNINSLKEKLHQCKEKKVPVLAVVACIGTTEEGAIDPLHLIASTRVEFEKQYNLSFWIHADAAYGGYLRSILIKPMQEDKIVPEKYSIDELRKLLEKKIKIEEKERTVSWFKRDDDSVYKSLDALIQADSVTIDPHKLGYMHYPLGAVAFRNNEVRSLLTYDAPYIFSQDIKQGEGIPPIGKFIFEGSKPGASAAACWLAHRTIPIDRSGFGAILQESVTAAAELFERLNQQQIPVSKYLKIRTLTKPDSNIMCFVLNDVRNHALEYMNSLNRKIYSRFAITDKRPIQVQPFFLSRTEFFKKTYPKECFDDLWHHLEVDPASYDQFGLYVLRATVMSPWLSKSFGQMYLEEFVNNLISVSLEIIREGRPPED